MTAVAPSVSGGRDDLPSEGRGRFVGYVSAVTLLGCGLAIFAIVTDHPGRLPHLSAACWVAAIFVVLGELRPLLGPARWDAEGVPISSAFLFALLIQAGPSVVMILVFLATVVADLERRRVAWRSGFNVAQEQLAWLAAYVVLTAGGVTGNPAIDRGLSGKDLPIILLAAVAYFGVNNALVDTAIALREGVGLRDVVRRDLGYQALATFALLALAPMIVQLMLGSVWFMPLLLLPLAAVYVTVAISRDRDRQSLHDGLTGLPNRVLLLQRLDIELVAAQSHQRGSGALLLLDLDRFKEVNDTLGHHVGDKLLCALATRLRAAVRPEDTVARLGGDEFAILLPGVPEAGSATVLARRVQAALVEPFMHGDLRLDLVVSIGVALYPAHADDVETLLRHADVAMYQAKTGRTGLCVYSPERDHNSAERLALLGDLRRAVENRDLSVVYQPKVDAVTGRCTGMEALLRWHHPSRGPMSPDDFIALAEQSSVMEKVTDLVLVAGIEQAAAWRDHALEANVAVNVSVRDLIDPMFVSRVRTLLAEHRLPGSALTLEVTERVLAHDYAQVALVLDQLTAIGIEISLDDFGTGYSSLARLETLPVSEIKIDRTFISRLRDGDDAPIVRSCIEMAHALGLRVVAEGVEDENSARRLTEYGCDCLQGYGIAPPMSGDDATEWLVRYADAVPLRLTSA